MAAPKGNEFWKLHSKHGKDKLFASPELMWEAACEYFEWCDKNPLIEIDFRGRDIQQVLLPHPRPYTIQGLCLYIGCSTSYFRTFKCVNKSKEQAYLTVITRIEQTIYNQQLSGAASGFLNPNIIARNLGLSEKTENTHKVNMFSDLNPDEIKKTVSKLKDAVREG